MSNGSSCDEEGGLTLRPACFDDLPANLRDHLWIASAADLDGSSDIAGINGSASPSNAIQRALIGDERTGSGRHPRRRRVGKGGTLPVLRIAAPDQSRPATNKEKKKL